MSSFAKALLPAVDPICPSMLGRAEATGIVSLFGPLRSTVKRKPSPPAFGTANAGLAHLALGFGYVAPTSVSFLIVSTKNSLCLGAYLR